MEDHECIKKTKRNETFSKYFFSKYDLQTLIDS
jgi:hypothetical protein